MSVTGQNDRLQLRLWLLGVRDTFLIQPYSEDIVLANSLLVAIILLHDTSLESGASSLLSCSTPFKGLERHWKKGSAAMPPRFFGPSGQRARLEERGGAEHDLLAHLSKADEQMLCIMCV